MRFIPGDRLTWVLLPLCGMLVLALAGQVGQMEAVIEPSAYAVKPVPLEGLGQVVTPAPLSAYEEIAARPLFNRGRKPSQKKASTAAVNLPFLIEGIVIGEGQKVVLLKGKRDKKLKRMREGEVLEGWRLEEVTAKAAYFSSRGRQQRIDLKNEPTLKQRETLDVRAKAG